MLLCNVPVCKYLMYLQTCLLLGGGVSTILFLWGFCFFYKTCSDRDKETGNKCRDTGFPGQESMDGTGGDVGKGKTGSYVHINTVTNTFQTMYAIEAWL